MEVILLIFVITTIFSIPAWTLLWFAKKSYFWDYGISYYGAAVWILLTYLNVGGQSLTNVLLETAYLNLFAILMALVRLLIYKFAKISNKTISVISIILVILFVVGLKLLVPTLSE